MGDGLERQTERQTSFLQELLGSRERQGELGLLGGLISTEFSFRSRCFSILPLCCFSDIKLEGVLFASKAGLAREASLTGFSLLSPARHLLLELLTFCSSWILDFKANKLMCKMSAENDFHRAE